jgi:hypothetical protein
MVTLLFAWPATASASSQLAGDTHHVYTYVAPSYDAPGDYPAPERGPPVKGYVTTAYDVVDCRSNGASARQSGPRPRATYDYDGTRLLVQSDIVVGTSSGAARVRIGALPVFDRAGVAAKTGTALGPARSTDLVLDSFRKLCPGRNAHVRTSGSVDELQYTFNAWTVGAERLAARGPKVPDVYRLPDGGTIQWRTSSGTGGPTIDIFPVSGRMRTVHLAGGVPW